MSQISLSSLLSQIGAATDGGTKLRPSAAHADASSRQDFASLIAGRMQSGSSDSTPVDGTASASKASTSVPVSAPENAASTFAKVFSQVSASHGHASTTTESTTSASDSGTGPVPLLHLVVQMRALLARIHPDAPKVGAAAGASGQQGARAAAGSGASIEGLSLNDAIRALKDLFVKAGIAPSAVADAKSAATKSTGQAKVDGADDGQSAEQSLASLLSLMQSFQTALKNQAQKIAQGVAKGNIQRAQATTDAGAVQLAALQQLQQLLQDWSKQVVQMQQSGSVGRGDLRGMLAQLQAALSTKEGDVRPSTATAAGDRAVTTAGAGQSVSQNVGEGAKSAPDGRQPDWMVALRQQNAQMHSRAAQHADTQGQAGRDAGTTSNQSGSTAFGSLSAAALSAAARPNQGPASAATQGFLGAAVDPASYRDPSAQGAGSVNSAALGGASLSGVASAMTALTGSHTSAGIFGSGGVQPQANPQLASGVGQQIQWMVGKSVSSASINVTPADLGPLKIHVQMQQDGGLQVQLMAHQHMTRDMLEQSLPRLRDWLQEAGLGQANVSVGPDTSGDTGAQLAQQQGQGSGSASSTLGTQAGLSGATDSGIPGHETRILQGPVTLLDLFA